MVAPQKNTYAQTDTALNIFFKLTEGHAVQTKNEWRYWIVLAIVSSIVLISGHEVESRAIPIIGKMSAANFYAFTTLLISALIIVYGSAATQAVRTRKLLQRFLNSQEAKLILPGNIYLQDAFDGIASPSFNRIAPLAQELQGKHQFFPESFSCPRWRRIIGLIYYILLKLIIMLVQYGLPVYALGKTADFIFKTETSPLGIPYIFYKIFIIFGCIVVLQLIVKDLRFMKGVFDRITSKGI